MKKNTGKKLTYVSRVCMTVLTTVLIVLFFCIMSLVGKIQGTARVVNYAGLVRGMTQRMVKLENSGSPQDEMIGELESIISGLRYGSDDLNLVRLDDKAFQDKMQELADYFETLKMEVQLVRKIRRSSKRASSFSRSVMRPPAWRRLIPSERQVR